MKTLILIPGHSFCTKLTQLIFYANKLYNKTVHNILYKKCLETCKSKLKPLPNILDTFLFNFFSFETSF